MYIYICWAFRLVVVVFDDDPDVEGDVVSVDFDGHCWMLMAMSVFVVVVLITVPSPCRQHQRHLRSGRVVL